MSQHEALPKFTRKRERERERERDAAKGRAREGETVEYKANVTMAPPFSFLKLLNKNNKKKIVLAFNNNNLSLRARVPNEN